MTRKLEDRAGLDENTFGTRVKRYGRVSTTMAGLAAKLAGDRCGEHLVAAGQDEQVGLAAVPRQGLREVAARLLDLDLAEDRAAGGQADVHGLVGGEALDLVLRDLDGAREGAKVVVADLNEAGAKATAAQISASLGHRG